MPSATCCSRAASGEETTCLAAQYIALSGMRSRLDQLDRLAVGHRQRRHGRLQGRARVARRRPIGPTFDAALQSRHRRERRATTRLDFRAGRDRADRTRSRRRHRRQRASSSCRRPPASATRGTAASSRRADGTLATVDGGVRSWATNGPHQGRPTGTIDGRRRRHGAVDVAAARASCRSSTSTTPGRLAARNRLDAARRQPCHARRRPPTQRSGPARSSSRTCRWSSASPN